MKRLGPLVFAAIAALLLAPNGSFGHVAKPVVKGNQIVDQVSSKVFVPRGVNFPGFEYACHQGWDYGEKGTSPEEADSTAAAIAAWKINTVRVPLNQDCWMGEDGMPAGALTVAGYRSAVEGFVDSLNAVGIVAILDLHWTGPDGTVADGLRPMPDNKSGPFWVSVANHFRDYESVIFDLFNEPHSRWNSDHSKVFGLTWHCWANGGCNAPMENDLALVSGVDWFRTAGMGTLVEAVRATGASQPILLSGIDYANDLRGWFQNRPDDDQLIAGFHNYPGQRCNHLGCWHSELVELAMKVPVLAAEFGQSDCSSPDHSERFMKWADSEGIGYLAWAWWDLPELGCRNFALVSDLDGTPLPPVGTALYQHLAALPDANGPAPPGPKIHSRMRIGSVRWNRPILNLGLTIDPLVRAKIRLRIRLKRDRRAWQRPRTTKRRIERRLLPIGDKARLRVRIPVGLRPNRLVITYPGDRRFHPKTIKRNIPSVLRLTRPR